MVKKTEKSEKHITKKPLEKDLFLNLFKKGIKNKKNIEQNQEKRASFPVFSDGSATRRMEINKSIKKVINKPVNKTKNIPEKKINKKQIVLSNTNKTHQLEVISDFQRFWQNKTYYIFKDLINKKVHIGQHKKYLSNEMQPYIFGYLNDFCIINLNQTIIQLRSALKILYETISNGGHITIIGTKTAYLDHVELFANNLGLPYVASTKWLGGSLTNFEIIEKNFNKQLKKEKIDINLKGSPSFSDAEFENINESFDNSLNIQNSDTINYKKLDLFKGLQDMGPSDLLIVLNPLDNQNALNEARILGIPVIGLVDTNTSLNQYKLIDYPIVANNESLLSVSYFLQLFNFTIRSGLIKKNCIKQKERASTGSNLVAGTSVLKEFGRQKK